MRIGLFLAYWPWFSPEEQVDLAVLADPGAQLVPEPLLLGRERQVHGRGS